MDLLHYNHDTHATLGHDALMADHSAVDLSLQNHVACKSMLAKNNAQIDLNDHGYHAGTNINHPTDHGNIDISGSAGGDWHGHDTFGGGMTYHDNSGFTIGGNASMGPGGSYNIGGSVGFEW